MQMSPVSPAVPPARRARVALGVAVLAFAAILAAYLAEIKTHQLSYLFSWYDLHVYNRGGRVALYHPSMLYVWRSIKFTYTPFAALVFALTALLPWAVLKVLTTVTSVIALAVVIWLTFGGLGWRGRPRLAATLGLFAVGLWCEPVQRGLHLGQIELWLMLLIVWDMCLSDRRWWKGAGVGVAAGIKLVPLIFIPYLVLAGKLRQAAVATAVFAGTVLIGFAFLPAASAKWWLTGYFLNSGNVGGVESLLNQSVLGMITRAENGNIPAATAIWVGVAALLGVAGLAAAAVLHRAGQPVAGWVACALTGLLVSPISWDHHWLWVVPGLAVLADAAVRRRGGRRWTWWLLAGFLVAVYEAWPRYWIGPKAFLPDGLLGFLPHAQQAGLQWINLNLFVLAGLVMFAVVLTLAAGIWLAGRAGLGRHRAGPADLPAPAAARQTG